MTRKRIAELEGQVASLRQEVDRLRARPAVGRPSRAPSTEKDRLVALVCERRGWTKGELAARLTEALGWKVDQAFLSPSRVFPAGRRDEVMARLREWAGQEGAGEKK